MATSIAVVGDSAEYREVLRRKLMSSGFDVVDVDGDAVMVCCTSPETWKQAAVSALWTPTVVIVADIDMDSFTRALALGAGVVHLDTPTNVMVDVLVSAMAGEALLPVTVAQTLASNARPSSSEMARTQLEGIELQIVDNLLDDQTIGQIAQNLNYSDRTIRRKLNSIYQKLGVTDRISAIRLLRFGTDASSSGMAWSGGEGGAIDLRS